MNTIFELSNTQAPFNEMQAAQVAGYLRNAGIDAVVKVTLDRDLIAALHDRGIKAYHETSLFQGLENWDTHSESRPITATGEPLDRDVWYAGVCPNQEWRIRDKLDECRTAVEDYGTDGIWLDFIRWPARWEAVPPNLPDTCYCPVCLDTFGRDTGIPLPLLSGTPPSAAAEAAAWIKTNCLEEWETWRMQVILNIVRRFRDLIPKTTGRHLGLFSVPFKRGDYADAVRRIVGQDLGRLGPELDFISPMVYHHLMGRDLQWLTDVIRDHADWSRAPILPVVQSLDEPTSLGTEEFTAGIQAARHAAPEVMGVMIFTTQATVETGKWDAMDRTFKTLANR